MRNFGELRKAEVGLPIISLPRTPVNRSKREITLGPSTPGTHTSQEKANVMIK